MGVLRFAITDLYGAQRAVLQQFSEGRVTITRNAERTASVTLSIHDPACDHVLPLERMLKVWYAQPDRTDLVFWGPINTPLWDPESGNVQVAAHDMSLRLKHHYLREGDAAVTRKVSAWAQVAADLGEGRAPADDDFEGSVPVSHTGMRRLRDAGKNSSEQNAAGIPDLGIANGYNSHPGAMVAYAQTTTSKSQPRDATLKVRTTIGFPNSGTLRIGGSIGAPPDPPAPGETVIGGDQVTYSSKDDTTFKGVEGWNRSGTIAKGTSVISTYGRKKRMKCARGEEVWAKMVELAELPTGPDFDLEPVDSREAPGIAEGLYDWVGEQEIGQYDADANTGEEKVFTRYVDNDGLIDDLNVSLWATTVPSYLNISLIHPDGTVVTLTEDFSGPYEDGYSLGIGVEGNQRVIFSDDASRNYWDAPYPTPFVGYFKSMGGDATWGNPNIVGLEALQGKPAEGTWRLVIYSEAETVTHLRAWGMNFHKNDPPEIAVSPTPVYAQLNTYNKLESRAGGARDKTKSIVFHYGFGRENVSEFRYTPGGDRVRNHVVTVTANSGADASNDRRNRAIRTDFAARVRYGTYVHWEAAGELDSAANPQDVLVDLANYYLMAYRDPVQAMEFTPKLEAATEQAAYSYGPLKPGEPGHERFFRPGDLISVAARKGRLNVSGEVLVTEVELAQGDEAGNVQTRVTVIPYVEVPATALDSDESGD